MEFKFLNQTKSIHQNIVTGVALADLAMIGVPLSANPPAAADHTATFEWVILEQF